MAHARNLVNVMASWRILRRKPVRARKPNRLVGPAMQYSISAIAHETSIAFQSGQSWPYFRWPYQAKVMNTLDPNNSRLVIGNPFIDQAAPFSVRAAHMYNPKP